MWYVVAVVWAGFAGALLGYRGGYAIGHMDGGTGWHQPWPWKQAEKTDQRP